MFSGGNLGADPIVKKLGITNNVITPLSFSDQTNLSLTINPNTGSIMGTYVEAHGTTNSIQGAIFQNSSFSAGYFFGGNTNGVNANTNESGLFMLYGE